MQKRFMILAIIVAVSIISIPSKATADDHGPGKEKFQLIAQIVTKLMSKGDESVIAIGRILKAETYRKKLNNPQKALEELNKLTSEIHDSELLFAANTIKMLILKETEKDPQKYLASLDKIIANASREKNN